MSSININKILVFFIVGVTSFLFVSITAQVKSTDRTVGESGQKYLNNNLQDQLEELERQLAEIQSQMQDINKAIQSEKGKQSNLSKDISYLDKLITQAELDIASKEIDIEKKETEIKILEESVTDKQKQITNLQNNITRLESTANNIVNSIYVESKTNSLIDLLLTSQKGMNFVSAIEYHISMGQQDKTTLEAYKVQKEDYENTKDEIQLNKIEQEKIAYQIELQKQELEKAKEQLAQQKNDKNRLLSQSYANVNSYYGKLENLTDAQLQAIAEKNLILQQIQQSIGNMGNGTYVIAGTWIAKEGSTGCSSGNHGHVVVLYNNQVQNPCAVFPTKTTNWGAQCGISSAPFQWPMRNDKSWTITGAFNSGWHEAIDLSYIGNSDYFVAPFNGYLHYTESGCSSSWCNPGTLGIPGVACNGAAAKGVILCQNQNCSTGYQIGFWHVQ